MGSKKKILILIDWYLPGTNAGGPVRSVHAMVMHLRNEFDFYILTTNKDLGEAKPYDNVQPDVWLEKDGYHVKYLSRANPSVLSTELTDNTYYKIYINSLYSKWFSVVPLRMARHLKIMDKVILAPRGMLGKGALSIKPLKKRVFLIMANILGWFKGITWHATGEHEKKDIEKRIGGQKQITLAPNLSWIKIREGVQKKKEPGQLNVFFLSRIARVKNLHIALKMLHEIPTGNQIAYDIYGPLEDADYWDECNAIMGTLPGHIRVAYKGTMDHDTLANVLQPYHALFMPTSNENFGHAIIESMACGCPVLISDQTPWRNLETQKAGLDLSLSDTSAYTKTLQQWCSLNQNEWNEWVNGATQTANRFLTNSSDKDQYRNLFN